MKSYQVLFFIVFVLFKNSFVYSQKEINHFVFHNGYGLNFNTPEVSLFTAPVLGVAFGRSNTCAVSDADGNLLFYTNGNVIRNRNHQVMPNGSGIYGANSATFECCIYMIQNIIVPKPGSTGKYLVFATSRYYQGNRLYCSEVDMNLNNGMGDVVSKNVFVANGTAEGLTAVKQRNTGNIWIMYKTSSSDYSAFLITPSGIQPPVVSASFVGENVRDELKFSPDGKKLAINGATGGVFSLADFDSDTGIVSNYGLVNNDITSYEAEFSPSSKYVYQFVTSGTAPYRQSSIRQYDITNLSAPIFQLNMDGRAGGVFLGPDGRIYFSRHMDNQLKGELFVIEKPELQGVNCNIKKVPIDILYVNDQTFSKYFRSYALNPYKVETCQNTNTQFYANSMNTINSVTWNFGDGTNGSGQNTMHSYSAAGTYLATATLQTSNGIENIEKTVYVLEAPTAPSLLEQYFCLEAGGNAFNLQQLDPSILGTQSPANFSVTYFASLQDAQSNILELNPNVNITQDVTYYARISIKNDVFQHCVAFTEIKFHAYPKPVLNIQDKYYLCENSSVVLNSASGFDHYLWSTGATTQSITATSPGIYTVTVKDDHPNVSCETTKNIEVVSSNKATIVNIDISDFTTGNNSFLVLVSGSGDYQYSMDGVHYQDSNAFGGLGSGEFMVYVKDKNGCGISQESVFLLSYPSFFTPNADGFNDVWSIKYSYTDPDLTISIFDRYGKMIKVLSGSELTWDGTLNGAMLPSTDYWFVAKRGNGKTVKGHFSLKR